MAIFKRKQYRVKLRGRAGGFYIEGKKKIKIDSEMLVGATDIIIRTDSIASWEPPFEKEILSSEDRNRIIANIRAELARAGLKVQFE